MELAARDLGIDSAEMRRRNLVGTGEMPYPLPRLEPIGPAGDTECDSGETGTAAVLKQTGEAWTWPYSFLVARQAR